MRSILILLALLLPVTANARTSRATPTIGKAIEGLVSWFGGPDDRGVKSNEGLALLDKREVKTSGLKRLFLPKQPRNTSGLARKLNPNGMYVAMRWNYRVTPREQLRNMVVIIKANGRTVVARPVDWGPAPWTGCVADVSPGCLKALGIESHQKATLILVPKIAATKLEPMPDAKGGVGAYACRHRQSERREA